MASTQSAAATLRAAWIAHAQARPIVTLGLIGTVLVVLTLSIASGYNAFQNGNESNVRYALLGGCASTGVQSGEVSYEIGFEATD